MGGGQYNDHLVENIIKISKIIVKKADDLILMQK